MLQEQVKTTNVSFQKAYNSFIKRYDAYIKGQSYQLARSFNKDEMDVAQDIYEYLWKYGQQWEESKGPINPYLYRLVKWAVQTLIKSWRSKAKLKEYNASSFTGENEDFNVLDKSSEDSGCDGWVSDSYGRVEQRVIAKDFLQVALAEVEKVGDLECWSVLYSLLNPQEQAKLMGMSSGSYNVPNMEICSVQELSEYTGVVNVQYVKQKLRSIGVRLGA